MKQWNQSNNNNRKIKSRSTIKSVICMSKCKFLILKINKKEDDKKKKLEDILNNHKGFEELEPISYNHSSVSLLLPAKE